MIWEISFPQDKSNYGKLAHATEIISVSYHKLYIIYFLTLSVEIHLIDLFTLLSYFSPSCATGSCHKSYHPALKYYSLQKCSQFDCTSESPRKLFFITAAPELHLRPNNWIWVSRNGTWALVFFKAPQVILLRNHGQNPLGTIKLFDSGQPGLTLDE